MASLRERNRQAAYAEIHDTAMRLFATQGFENTTVEQIAAEVGISARTFFRYYTTKEDIVVGDVATNGERVRAALAAQPPEVGPWDAILAALATLSDVPGSHAYALMIAELTSNSPALRARHLEKHLRWQAILVPELERRLGVTPGPVPDPRAHAIVGACLACLDTAMEIWARRKGEGSLEEIFLQALAAIRS